MPPKVVTKTTPGPTRPTRRPTKKRAAKNPLTYLQLQDPREALLIAPERYIDCTKFVAHVTDVAEKETAMFRLTLTGKIRGFDKQKQPIWSVPDEHQRVSLLPKASFGNTRRIEAMATDQRGQEVTISSFNGPAQWVDAQQGTVLHVTGSYQQFGRRLFFSIEENVPASAIGAAWVKYPHVPGQISAERVALAVATARLDESSWRHCAGRIIGECSLSETEILTRIASDFTSLVDLLKALHEPRSPYEGQLAQEDVRRISALAIQVAALRSTSRAPHPDAPIPLDPTEITRLAQRQQESLTDDQIIAARRIADLLVQPKAMVALLVGDVGTGKTLTYLLPAVAAHRAGAKVAVIAPTTLLADQLYQQLVVRFGSEIRGAQRLEAGQVIQDPSYVIIGTPGLVGATEKSGYIPNLLICDEQHKMGTATREDLLADWTHLLEVSATPIPRSLATALYDGMDILTLRQSPVQKDIRSYVVDMGQKREMIQSVRQALSRGERCAFVYPLVSNEHADGGIDPSASDEATVHSVESAYDALERAFPGKVVMLHGQMGQDELRRGITLLRSGERQIMVASTVIETGLDIPSISMMVVRNADRFGVSQLHQLRGRLVRNGGTGNFLMAVESFSDFPDADDQGTPNATLQRLDAVAASTDGYELAERDLLLRGFGDLTGLQQSGAAKTVFRLVDLRIEDFMARKLRALHVEPVERPSPKLAQPQDDAPSPQTQLFGGQAC